MRFVRNRGQVPDRGVQPIVVVPVDPAGDLPVDVTEVAPGVAADFGRQQTDGRLAQGVLSRASPTVPIGGDPGFEQFRGQSHGRAGGIQRPACLEQRDADLRHPCSPDLWASCRRHERESRLMALGCRGRFLRLTEPARVVWSGATSSSSSGRGTERIGTLCAWRRRSQSRLCGAGSPRIVWLVAHSQHGAAFSSVSS